MKLKILDDYPSQISSNKLPSNGDIIKAISFEKESAKISTNDAIKIVTSQMIELWKRAAIPIITKQRLNEKLVAYFDEYTKLHQSDDKRTSFDANLNKFKVIIYQRIT